MSCSIDFSTKNFHTEYKQQKCDLYAKKYHNELIIFEYALSDFGKMSFKFKFVDAFGTEKSGRAEESVRVRETIKMSIQIGMTHTVHEQVPKTFDKYRE